MHPHVNVVVLFGTTPDGAVPDRANGGDVTDRFVPLAASEFGVAPGLRAALGDGALRIDANNKLKLRIRSLPITVDGRTRRLKDKERVASSSRHARTSRPTRVPAPTAT